MAYQHPSKENWSGRHSEDALYLHEKINCLHIHAVKNTEKNTVAILGYACDEGVGRNQGRVGAKAGPYAIRKQLAKMPNHLTARTLLVDVGDVSCLNGAMETAQKELSENLVKLLGKKVFPIVLGGGHDMAYGTYCGIHSYLDSQSSKATIGIINFDAHFDLRSNETGNTSGTPFYQIAQENDSFAYFCLGIRKDANDRLLFQTAKEHQVQYIENDLFSMTHYETIKTKLEHFIGGVDHIYITIDLDGFSSAYAPGVSAASPMGFEPRIVTECLSTILSTQKVICVDIAEMNPTYDRDHQTAKLAASLIHHIIHSEFR